MNTEVLTGLRCKTCGNTETFKREYYPIVRETVVINQQGYVTISDRDIVDDNNRYGDMVDEYTCAHCLSGDIDMTGVEDLWWPER